jgi:hypothetical protein
MTSTRKRDRFFRMLNRGELQRAVKKCGEDVHRSLETFKVCMHVFKFINSDGSGRSRFKLNKLCFRLNRLQLRLNIHVCSIAYRTL